MRYYMLQLLNHQKCLVEGLHSFEVSEIFASMVVIPEKLAALRGRAAHSAAVSGLF